MSDNVTVKCRFCAATNRFPVERALADLGAVKCGSCGEALLRVSGEPLTGIVNDDLCHPFDSDALRKLKAIPLADEILGKLMGSTLDKLTRFHLLADAVRVDARQMPSVHKLYLEAAGRIDVDPPPLFVVQTPMVNAYAMGAGQPMVAVTSGLLDMLDEREICGVLGHELTHVRLGHVLYRTLAILLMNGGLKVLDRFMGIGRILVMPLQIALYRWYQMSELSADRGELLTSGSMETYVKTHLKLCGGNQRFADELDVAAFIDQAHDAEKAKDSDLLVYVMELFQGTFRTHPLPAWRVHHSLNWAKTQRFFEILAGTAGSDRIEDGATS